MVKRNLPAYVRAKKGRGRTYYYFERGGDRVRINAEPGTADFALAYARLLQGRPAPPTSRSVGALVALYKSSERWGKLADNTRKSYSRALDYIADRIGDVDPLRLRRVHVLDMQAANAAKPTTANRRVDALRALLEHGIDIGWLDTNVAKGVRSLPGKRPPRQPWPADKIEAFRAAADDDTLLIFELLLGTGQRIGDVLAMQWGHVEAGGIHLRQAKTRSALWVPWTRRLAQVIDAAPRRGLFIACQPNGRAWSYNGAWRRITEIRKAIGAEGYDIHALRHTAASELAALGLSDETIMAVTGHRSSAMVQLYAGAAAQKARAKKAQERRE